MRTFAPTRRTLLVVIFALALVACGGGSSSKPTSQGALAYTALGASDAVGIGAVPFSRGYVPLLADDMTAVGYATTLRNLGISGARVGDIIDDELPDALASNPDIVTLWTGANDLIGGDDPDAFAADLAFLLTSLEDGTDAQVFVGDLPDLTQAPLFSDGSDPDVTAARVDAFNTRIHAAIADAGFVLVRISDVELTEDLTWVDGFHPNNEGHALLADSYWAEIAPRL